MERKSGNTIMLTVIAIATLLVAVVGATFAYFSANTQGNEGTSTVKVQTAAAADTFITTGEGSFTIDVTADKMQEAIASDTVLAANLSDSSDIVVSLEAGSSVATCTYDIVYYPDVTSEGYTAFSATPGAANLNEFVVSATAKGSTGAQKIEEVQLAGSEKIVLKDNASISDTYETASAASTDTWTFTYGFYNLKTVDQTEAQKNQKHGGVIKIEDVVCTNAAASGN